VKMSVLLVQALPRPSLLFLTRVFVASFEIPMIFFFGPEALSVLEDTAAGLLTFPFVSPPPPHPPPGERPTNLPRC